MNDQKLGSVGTDVRLELLGHPAVLIDTEAVSLPPRHYGLLCFLAMRGQAPVSRAEIASLLWPKSGVGAARHCLSQALYSLKYACREAVLVEASPTTVRLRGVPCDLRDFDLAVERCDWLAAARLLRGLPLDGIDLPKCYDFTEWLDGIRQQYLQRALGVLESLVIEGHVDHARRLALRLPHDSASCLGNEVEMERRSSDPNDDQ
jgi:DNA-binding SARP family transcriptional activator